MVAYNDFRIQIREDNPIPGQWDVELTACPILGLQGPKGSILPIVSRRMLRVLRSRHGWPDLGKLTQIGAAVWKSVMTAELEAAFEVSLAASNAQGKGMRITVVSLASETHTIEDLQLDGPISLPELPVEMMYSERHGFLATDVRTPIRRGLQADFDRAALPVALPLRVLVAVATPADRPEAREHEELDAIREALAPLVGSGGPIVLDICKQPTRQELNRRVNGCHVFHFVGHGGFSPVGDDPTARAYITVVKPNGKDSDWLGAHDLANILRGSTVRMAVFSACVSAAITGDEEPFSISAFGGLAQRLMGGVSGMTATIAMQFDMEADAAIIFSRTLYEKLAVPELTLDETVTLARKAVAVEKELGHRAWVTPTLYDHSMTGQVFTLVGQEHPEKQPPSVVPPNGPRNVEKQPNPTVVDKRALRDAMNAAFTLEELELLCADTQQILSDHGHALQVDMEIVGGNSKAVRILNLIMYMERRGALTYLLEAIRQQRPQIMF